MERKSNLYLNYGKLRFYYYPRGTSYDGFSGHFFVILKSFLFCFFVAIFDLVHDVEATHGLC